MVINRGRLINNCSMKIQREEMSSLAHNPMKPLYTYDDSLGDHRNVDNIKTLASFWLSKVDKFSLPGKYKAWIYQHGILPEQSSRQRDMVLGEVRQYKKNRRGATRLLGEGSKGLRRD